MIKKILVAHKTKQYPNQNIYIDKRIHSAGQNISKQFRKTFNYLVIRKLRYALFEIVQSNQSISKGSVNPMDTVVSHLSKNYE